jgi:hemolysin III
MSIKVRPKKIASVHIPLYTIGEEIAHSITHGIGVALSIAGLTVLVVLAVLYGSATEVISFSIYGASLIAVYLTSTLYHSLQHLPTKQLLRVLDHAAIYLLIAGTYTPFLLVGLPGVRSFIMLAMMWALAGLGMCFKVCFIDRFEKLSIFTYIGMGWLGVFLLDDMLHYISLTVIVWLAIGGVVYTVGVVFYKLKNLPYNHAIWHIFVLGGSLCHYQAVFYLAPMA